MADTNAVVSVYNTHEEAENAVKELQKSGFDMKRLSIIGKDFHTEEDVVGFYNSGERVKHWGKLGAFWGGIWGLLLGWGIFFVPGVGPFFMAGPIAGFLIAALEDAVVVGGLSALGAALYSIGIPRDSILSYETAVKSGKFVLIAHGTAEDLAKARTVVGTTGATVSTVTEG